MGPVLAKYVLRNSIFITSSFSDHARVSLRAVDKEIEVLG